MAEADRALDKFNDAMDDDLNTADALGAMFELAREVFRLPQTGVSRKALAHWQKILLGMTGVLGSEARPVEAHEIITINLGRYQGLHSNPQYREAQHVAYRF